MARRSPARVIGGRLLQAVPVILLATFIVFALLKLVPGDIAVTLGRRQRHRRAHCRDQEHLRPRPAIPGAIWRVARPRRAGRSLAIAADRAKRSRPRSRRAFPEHAADRGDRAGARAAHGDSDGRGRGDQAQWLGRQDGQHDRLARRRHTRLLAGDDPGRRDLAEAELAARRPAQNRSAFRRGRRSGTRCCRALPSRPTAWPKWRGSCGDRCSKCCRRNMCGRCTPRGCR